MISGDAKKSSALPDWRLQVMTAIRLYPLWSFQLTLKKLQFLYFIGTRSFLETLFPTIFEVPERGIFHTAELHIVPSNGLGLPSRCQPRRWPQRGCWPSVLVAIMAASVATARWGGYFLSLFQKTPIFPKMFLPARALAVMSTHTPQQVMTRARGSIEAQRSRMGHDVTTAVVERSGSSTCGG